MEFFHGWDHVSLDWFLPKIALQKKKVSGAPSSSSFTPEAFRAEMILSECLYLMLPICNTNISKVDKRRSTHQRMGHGMNGMIYYNHKKIYIYILCGYNGSFSHPHPIPVMQKQNLPALKGHPGFVPFLKVQSCQEAPKVVSPRPGVLALVEILEIDS